jgi:hypothetical protein
MILEWIRTLRYWLTYSGCIPVSQNKEQLVAPVTYLLLVIMLNHRAHIACSIIHRVLYSYLLRVYVCVLLCTAAWTPQTVKTEEK